MTNNIPIIRNLTPWELPNRNGGKLDLSRGGLHITMHDTDNKARGADALMHDRWQDATYAGGGVQAGVGVHLYVDDIRCVQKLPLDEIGYHAGDGCNNLSDDVGCFRSVSIEMCVNSDADHAKVARNAAQIVARIALGDPAFDWGGGSTKGKFSIERIDQHRWVTQSSDPHDCPHSLRYADYGTNWEQWLRMVDEEWAARTGTTPAPRPPQYAEPYEITWKRGDVGLGKLGPVAKVRKLTVELTAVRDTQPRQSASAKSPRSGPEIKTGSKVVAIGTLLVPNGKRVEQWHVLLDGHRVPASAFEPRLPKP